MLLGKISAVGNSPDLLTVYVFLWTASINQLILNLKVLTSAATRKHTDGGAKIF